MTWLPARHIRRRGGRVTSAISLRRDVHRGYLRHPMHDRPGCFQWAAALVAAGLILAAVPASAWETVLPFSDYSVDVPGLFVADDGDVSIVANFDERNQSGTMVASLRGIDGAMQWRMSPDLGWKNRLNGAVQAVNGDIIATGFIAGAEIPDGVVPTSIAIRVDHETGDARWQTDLAVGDWRAVAVDRRGDVLVSGRGLLAKLFGATGTIAWLRDDLEYFSTWNHPVAVDRAGDVLVGMSGAVGKYDGRSGRLLWRQPASLWGVNTIYLVSGGDVLTVDCDQDPLSGDFATQVVMRRGADGAERWRYSADSGLTGCNTQAVVTPDHRIVLAHVWDDGAWIARLNRRDGSIRWRRPLSAPDSFPSLLSVFRGAVRDEVVVQRSSSLWHSRESLSAFDGRAGHAQWEVTLEDRPYRAAPADSEHMVVAAESEWGSGILVEKVSVDRAVRGDRGRRRGVPPFRKRLCPNC